MHSYIKVTVQYVINVCAIGEKVMSAREAIIKFNVKLLQQLPLDDDIFFAMVKQVDLFPLDTSDSIAAKPTRAQKVSYFLQHIVEPGAEECLPKLLKVMKESNVVNVVRLADDIQAATRIIGTYIAMYINRFIVVSCVG